MCGARNFQVEDVNVAVTFDTAALSDVYLSTSAETPYRHTPSTALSRPLKFRKRNWAEALR